MKVRAALFGTLLYLLPSAHAAPVPSDVQRVVPELFGISEDTTFTDGDSVMYVQKGDFKVGVDKKWGGAIREIWFKNNNLVNNHDGGRLIGVSLYSGGDSYPTPCCNNTAWGWNPTPSDKYDHLNSPIDYHFDGQSLHVKARNIQWNPDNTGGGSQTAVPSEIVVETSIELLGASPLGIVHLTHRVTYDGNVTRFTTGQEFPFAYVRSPYSTFVSYAGDAPWTNAPAVSVAGVPMGASTGAATEHWAGFVDSSGVGLVWWAPQNYSMFPYSFFNGPGTENPTYYMRPYAALAIEPGFTRVVESYLLAGSWQDARAQIYLLHQSVLLPDVLPPWGNLESPIPNATISGVTDVSGWTFDDSGTVAKVEVLLDGQVVDRATYGLSRPDVAKSYPGVPGAAQCGFVSHLDTRGYSNGSHTLAVKVTDPTGNSVILPPARGTVTVTVRN